jgi:hypothetical protein
VARRLGDPSEKVRLEALRTLQLHPPLSLPGEAGALSRDESREVRYALIALLGEYRGGESDRLLSALLNDRDPGVAGRALREVSNRFTKSMAQALMKRLETRDVKNFDLFMQAMKVLAGRNPWKDNEASSMTPKQKVEAWKAWWQEHDVITRKLK